RGRARGGPRRRPGRRSGGRAPPGCSVVRRRSPNPRGTYQRYRARTARRAACRGGLDLRRAALARRVSGEGDDGPAPLARVDDVDRVVLPVGAGDTEEERQPAPEAESSLAGERAAEH